MTHDEKIVEALEPRMNDLNERALLGAATAALNARRAANGWPPTSLDKMLTADREAWIEDVRAAITAFQAEAWQPKMVKLSAEDERLLEQALAASTPTIHPILPADAGWRDISTAPKDGSRMLFFTGVAWVGYYRTGREPGAPPNAEWSEPGWTRLGFCDVGLKPTHWMPLPPSPIPRLHHE